jgi:hypothetical protein
MTWTRPGGSINWITSLPHSGFANNVSRITENVLRRFLMRNHAPTPSAPRQTP